MTGIVRLALPFIKKTEFKGKRNRTAPLSSSRDAGKAEKILRDALLAEVLAERGGAKGAPPPRGR